MAVEQSILTPTLSENPHLRAFIDASEAILSGYDITSLLVYIIDVAPVTVLPFLAGQFQVLGAGGWQYADTEQKQRDLLKRALELNRYKGTVWSVKEGLKLGGFGEVTLNEGVAGQVVYDGTYQHNGVIDYSFVSNQWATFEAIIQLNGQANNQATLEKATAIINFYKNTRSKLININFV